MIELTDTGLDPERLVRRMDFLEHRAAWHRESSEGLTTVAVRNGAMQPSANERVTRLACMGTLLRDAGAIALLLGNYPKAKELLREAGHILAGLGLFTGYMLLQVANRTPWWRDRESDLTLIRMALSPDSLKSNPFEMEELRRQDRPLLLSSAASIRQLLHLYQSIVSIHSKDQVAAALQQQVYSALMQAQVTTVGATHVPAQAYLNLLRGASTGELDRFDQETLLSMVLRRTEQLQVARADDYHWKRALNPADIIDFDFLVIFLAAINRSARSDEGEAEELTELLDGRAPLIRAPLEAARGIRQSARGRPDPGVALA